MTITTFNLTEGVEYPGTLNGSAYPCDYKVPEDGILNKYSDLVNSTCSFCAAICEAPAVSNKIGLFDGFNGSLVLYCYLGFAGFTVLYQILVLYCKSRNPISDDDMAEVSKNLEQMKVKIQPARINNTTVGTSAEISSR